jgi:guanylate kinase
LERNPDLVQGLTATTRAPRTGEVHGKDYWFLEREEFQRRVSSSEFAEWAEVHGQLYGTPRAELARLQATGKDALLQVDVQGMRNLKKAGLKIVFVFIMPPSIEELERRLRKRSMNQSEDMALRLRNARTEMEARHEYEYIVVNDNLDEAVADMESIIRAERLRAERRE